MARKNKYDALKLDNQICFPLYAASKEIIKRYKPHLEKLDLTYTQYITMLALWEHRELTVRELGDRLYLDSGTLTPLLKKLEAKELVNRMRSLDDERKVVVVPTEAGWKLRDKALSIPRTMESELNFDPEDSKLLAMTVNWLLDQLGTGEDATE